MSTSLLLYLAAMTLYWLLAAWVCNQPETKRGPAFRAITAAMLVWSCVLLTACGGGDPEAEEHDVQTPRVNCAQNPEACK